MNKLATLLIGSALTVLLAGPAFAADKEPATAPESKPAAASPAPAPAPATATTPAPAAAAATPAPSTPASAQADSKEQVVKIAFIDMAKIAADSAAGKAATTTLKAKSAKLRTKIEAKQKQLEQQKKSLETKIETMSPKERAAKGKEFQKKVEEYQKLVVSSENEMQEMQEKLTTDLYKEIKRTASGYAKSEGYAAVLEEKAVLYVSDSLTSKDVTDDIAALLDQKKK